MVQQQSEDRLIYIPSLLDVDILKRYFRLLSQSTPGNQQGLDVAYKQTATAILAGIAYWNTSKNT